MNTQTRTSSFLAIALLIIFAALPTVASAKAYFYSEAELVTKSTAIAIIEVSAPEGVEQQGKPFTYRQRASAKVQQVVKGDLPETITLYGKESFICAQCHLATGRYLAFLRKDGDLWVGSNWQLSLRPIKGDQVEWYAKPEERFPMKFQPMDAVLNNVRNILAAATASPPAPSK